ncbi:hypothetical protein Dsin_013036 [Dipteronia sinensis]|uniref:Reverse transcriptase zinc-binding domain-containing protein n=1 Tax=Dipteronia sinensis TaxID=43782 RepID=A0AAE0E8L4_9ROSI|nr:hypothetical protein Dsin_013036 [Dipteronia sinensis]
MDFGSWHGQRWVWMVPLRRQVFDWENDQWWAFLSRIEHLNPRSLPLDALAWSFSSNGAFSVGSFSRCLEDSSSNVLAEFTFVWQGIFPHKIEVFTWQLLRGKIMVRQVMGRFGFSPNLSMECPMCKSKIENQVIFKDTEMGISQAVDMVKFRVAWWFKHHGSGTSDLITSLLLNINDRCSISKPTKAFTVDDRPPSVIGALKFNVDGDANGIHGSYLSVEVCSILA